MRFTGGDNLTGFKSLVHNVFMKNELKNGEGAYEITYCKAGRSGYSFGPVQWDLFQNRNINDNLRARQFFEDILRNARDLSGNLIFSNNNSVNNILSKVSNIGQTLSPDQKFLINAALSSNYGVQKINEMYLTELDTAIAKIDGVINKVTDPISKVFLQTDFGRLFLIDYNNQFYIASNGEMEQFLKGGLVTLGYGKTVSINGNLGIEDLLNFCLKNKYGQDHPGDLIRRFSNIIEEVGLNNISLTLEDALFFCFDLRKLLCEKFYKIIFWNNDNWGIKNLSLKAFALYHETFYPGSEDYYFRLKMNGMLPIFHQFFPAAIAFGRSPLILDLDGDGVETTSLNDGTYFNHDGNGFAEQTGWASSDDGLLVWDRNGDGQINDGKELFGDQTLLKNGSRAANGFQALAEWDDNIDGKIDSNDSVWSNLKVWQDYDEDGFSSPDELLGLSDLGISSINTGYTNSIYIDPQGNEHRQVGSFNWSNGITGTATDVWVKTDNMYTIAEEWLDVPADISGLPDLQGFGNVYDLHQAIVRDTSGQLNSLVEQFMAATDPNVRNNLMDQILFKWTGSDAINPNSRGPFIDARKLAVLEKLFGEGFVGGEGPNPVSGAAELLMKSYKGIFEMYYAGLMSQTHLKDLYELITYSWDEATQSLRGNSSAVKMELETRYALDPFSGAILVREYSRTVKGIGAETVLGMDTLRSNDTFAWLMDTDGVSLLIEGTNANDTLIGTASSDAIRGGDGKDTIWGGGGNDILHGQLGDDVLDGGLGSDILVGGSGNDILGGAAFTSEDWANPNDGWTNWGNTYEGGPGNDTLRGTYYGDTYKFNLGDGQDVIQEYGTTRFSDILKFGTGINPSDVKVERSGNDLIFRHMNGADRITVQNWYGSTGGGYQFQLERIEFADGTVWNGADVHAQGLILKGTEGNDTLSGVAAYGDSISGLGGNDTIYGYGGNDTLDGGSGDDVLDGGFGSDILVGGSGNDILGGVAFTSEDWANPNDGWTNWGNTYEGGTGNDVLRGTWYGDTYKFNLGDGQDVIQEYGTTRFSDVLKFGSGINPSDIKVERSGNDLIFRHINGIDRITVQNWYIGYSGGYQLQLERVEFADGSVFNLSDLQLGTTNADTLTGTSYDSIMMGDASNDTLNGGAGNDLINGGSGADNMTGGLGNDIFVVDDSGDVVTEALNEGTDTVLSSITYSLGANLENLTLTGTTNINGTGNTLNNVLVGNSGANTLNGNTGSDTMSGGAGDDIYVVDNVGDIVTEGLNEGADTVQSSVSYTLIANVENLILTESAAINGTGNALNNVLTGNSAANVLTGGAGNDTYIVGTGDTVVENTNEGTDGVQSSVTFTLPSNVENLTLTGTSSINGTGNDLNNTLTGNSGANTLNGGLGADTMIGGAGNDTYVVDNTGDIITENLNQGTDTVQSTITYTLGSNLENLTLTGTPAINGTGNELNNVLTGNSAPNALTGNAGNDTLNGGAGADALVGGLGNDTYVVDDIGDMVTEAANEGTDTVQSYITYTLGNNIENLTLMGTSAINGTGNSLNNVLTGNSGANILAGGLGNDTYVIGAGDTVVENPSEGTDTIQTSITYTLGANIENLTLTGSSAINGTGNELNNSITGNSASNILTGGLGNDTLNGGAGADTLIGGLGNDTYVVDNIGDIVTESLSEGTDTVQSSITYTLGVNVENLTLTDNSAINGTGNDLNNTLTGNSGANILMGNAGNDSLKAGAGADTLDGGLGNDYLEGSTGNDLYLFGRGYGQDAIKDYDTTAGNSDKVKLFDLNPIDLIFVNSGNNLNIQINNSSDLLTIQNQNYSSAYKVEVFEAADGRQLLSSSVALLIQEMAGFSASTGMSWTQLIQGRPDEVQTILSHYWQPPM